MLYPQIQHSTATIALSTALQDKDGMYNRLRSSKPMTAGSRTLLNRTGHVVAGVSGECTSPHAPLSFEEERYYIHTMPH